jgi:hypothetical protein
LIQHLAVGSIFLLLITGCAIPLTPRESGTLTGAGIGAATGAILGGIAGSAGKGAAIGAVTGALVGNAIQNEQAARAYSSGYAYPTPVYPYYSPYGPPPTPPNATLQIEVTPDETEIAVDGRRIGQAKEFQGPAVVPVVAGPHLVEFHLRGFSVATNVMVPPQTTVPIRRDLAPTASASPQITPSGVPGRSTH